MLGKICLFVTLVTMAAFLTAPESLQAKNSEVSAVLFEMAPLKGAMGQVSLRAERRQSSQFAYGMGYESIDQPGERTDMEDHSKRMYADVLWYPAVEAPYKGVFFGVGAVYEQAYLGRSQERKYSSGTSPNSDELNDTWANNVNYYSLSQSFGYRFDLGNHFTTSMRYVIDELVYQQSSAHDEQIYSYGVETEAKRRDGVKQYLAFLAGVVF